MAAAYWTAGIALLLATGSLVLRVGSYTWPQWLRTAATALLLLAAFAPASTWGPAVARNDGADQIQWMRHVSTLALHVAAQLGVLAGALLLLLAVGQWRPAAKPESSPQD